ncbi:hypothetical protein GCM10010446_58610 [Streptomyces enissocaesilis]|uniref:Transposase n=1 Tax=Streptomyces enissocaesilis TaxID=332589 RepID=A0ABN3XNR6_9ACTN
MVEDVREFAEETELLRSRERSYGQFLALALALVLRYGGQAVPRYVVGESADSNNDHRTGPGDDPAPARQQPGDDSAASLWSRSAQVRSYGTTVLLDTCARSARQSPL